MSSDRELESLLDRVAKKILEKKEGEQILYRTKIVGVDSPHGIYRYNRSTREWVMYERDGECFKPYSDGYYVIYFDNTKCPACRIYDLFWYPFVETIGRNLGNVEFIIILCEWFARKCESKAASNSFKKFEIIASPTTVLLEARNGEITRQEMLRGIKKIDELLKSILQFTGIKIE